MSKLILVRHSLPLFQSSLAPTDWRLSEDGRARCAWLARDLWVHNIGRLFCSTELRARETAQIVGDVIGLQPEQRADLHENDRTDLGWLDTAGLRARLQRFFAEPNTLLMGRETAADAAARFAAAVRAASAEASGGNAAIIAHGAVITLFVAQYNKIPQFPFWDHLGAPAYVVLDAQTFKFDGKIHNFAG